MKIRFPLAVLFYLVASFAASTVRAESTAELIPVEVTSNSSSLESTNLCFAIRDKVRESHAFKLVEHDSEIPHIHILIRAMEVGKTGVLSVGTVWTLRLDPKKSEVFVMDQLGVVMKSNQAATVQPTLALTEKYWRQINDPAEP